MARKIKRESLKKGATVTKWHVCSPGGYQVATSEKQALKMAKEILGYSYTNPWVAIDVITTTRLSDSREGDTF